MPVEFVQPIKPGATPEEELKPVVTAMVEDWKKSGYPNQGTVFANLPSGKYLIELIFGKVTAFRLEPIPMGDYAHLAPMPLVNREIRVPKELQ